MIKKSFRLMLLAAFALSSVMFVACNKYDEDIERIDNELAALNATVSTLKSAVEGGAVISSVSNTADGVKFTLSNGQSYTVTNGATGATGAAGQDGKDGQDGKPGSVVTIGENGNWFIDGVDQNVSAVGASTFVVDCGSYYELNVVEKVDGENSEIVKINLPKTKAITSIAMLESVTPLRYADDFSPLDVNINYGITLGKNDKKEFNGVTYTKQTLVAKGATIAIAVNPIDADATLYNFELVDTKGNSPYVISEVKAHKSEGALTRAATANAGIYVLSVDYADGNFDATAINKREDVLYALTTATAEGTVATNYQFDVNENKVTTASFDYEVAIDDEKERVIDLEDCILDASEAVDYYFEIVDKTAAAAMGAQLNGSVLTASKEGKLDVYVHYFLVDGTIDYGTIKADFKYIAPEASLSNVTWTITDKTSKGENIVYVPLGNLQASLVGSSDTDLPIVNEMGWTWADGKEFDEKSVVVNGVCYGKADDNSSTTNSAYDLNNSMPAIGGLYYINSKGKYTAVAADTKIQTPLYVAFTFNHAVAFPGEYIVTLGLKKGNNTSGNNDFEVPVNVTVNAPEQAIVKYDNYFNGNNAVAYGKADGVAATYDLTQLFKTTGLTFAETTVKDADGNAYAKWLSGTVVTVPVYDYDAKDHNTTVYATREYTASIIPFGNNYIEATRFAFNLTVKSAIKEGSFTTSAVKTIETSAPVKFAVTDFAGVDVFGDKFYVGNVYDKDSKGNYLATTVEEKDDRIADVKVEAADDNAKNYLTIGQFKAKGTEAADAFEVSRKSDVTSLVVDTPCKVKVVITDKWGMKSEATVTVTLKAFGN